MFDAIGLKMPSLLPPEYTDMQMAREFGVQVLDLPSPMYDAFVVMLSAEGRANDRFNKNL